MKIEHRVGRLHRNADSLSRRVCKQCGLDCGLLDSEANESSVRQIQTQELRDEQDVEDLVSAQDADKDIAMVKEWVKEGSRPEQKQIMENSQFVKSLWHQFDNLKIKDEMLVRRWDVLGTDLIYWQAVVPLSQRRTVLRYSHDIKASGHLGIKKTLSRIRQKYYWPGCQNDVRNYVNGCMACAKRKGPTKTKRAPMQIMRSGYPMERIAVDILGELPETERGNKYILVISDYFTKWTESFPMPNMEAATVARIMVEQVICRFGVPRTIHSDQGRQFESKLFSEMCKLLQINKTRTTPYHPESDGMVERFNRTLCEMLSAYVNENHRDWDQHLPFVMMAYRAAEHETTGMSPNMLMLGREVTTPLDIVYAMPSSIKPVPPNQWVWELQEVLENAHSFVREYTSRSMRRQKRYHDSKLSFDKLEVGDPVYVYFPVKKTGTSSKLTSFWKGPFKVVEKISDVLFKIDCGRFGSFQVIHIDRLRKAKEQVLMGEESSAESASVPTDSSNSDTNLDISAGEAAEEAVQEFTSGGRIRRKPVWHQDYMF